MIETDVQKPVFRAPGLTLCRFHCPPGHARWSRENRIQDGHNLAFANRAVEIHHADHPPVLVDPNQAVFYNDGDLFSRRLVSADGDRASVFLFDSEHVVAAVRDHDPAVVDRPHAPFLLRHGTVGSRLYLRQRLLVDYAATSRAPDGLRILEEALAILGQAVAQTYRARAGLTESPTRAHADHLERVECAKERLARSYDGRITLEGLGRDVGLSVFHLCRVFRRATGLTIHHYLQRLRLRAALDLLADGHRSLAEIALDVGFSHQSHFTEAFRREYATPPGRLRRRLDGFPTGTSSL